MFAAVLDLITNNGGASMRRISARYKWMTAAVAAIVVAGAIAYAAIPDPDGVIHGCYEKTKVIDQV
jgi:hypothetical protein